MYLKPIPLMSSSSITSHFDCTKPVPTPDIGFDLADSVSIGFPSTSLSSSLIGLPSTSSSDSLIGSPSTSSSVSDAFCNPLQSELCKLEKLSTYRKVLLSLINKSDAYTDQSVQALSSVITLVFMRILVSI